MLDLAKASYDESEIKFKNLRIDEILIEARNSVLKNKPEYNINIKFNKEIEEEDYLTVNGNEYLLKTAFSNLIENGCKFSNNHLTEVYIDFNAKSTLLSFKDSGIGIPEDDIDNIFTSFFRGCNQTFAEGHGIGLSLSHKIIKLHKGHIHVKSTLGNGTLFEVEIPHM
jgi:two-component system, OmpR family, sensor histidine kinase ArlS